MASENRYTPPLLDITKFATGTKHSARSNVPNSNENSYQQKDLKFFKLAF